MGNQLNSGTLENLELGQTLLMTAKKVNGEKIQLMFAEIVQSNERALSALTVLNKSDDRFSSRARRSWVTAEPIDASDIFDLNFGDDGEWIMTEDGEVIELNILNPTYEDVRFRVVVSETIEASDWQKENLEKAAKRRGAEGEFILHNGSYIFSNTETVLTNEETKDNHLFLLADSTAIAAPATEETVEEVTEVFDTENVAS